MPLTVVIGAQWGDEGKGRVVDWLSGDADIVARYAGGDNAGHTVAVGDTIYKLHLIPSGIVRPNTVSVMGNGMVINPISLIREMDEMIQMGVEITPERLVISSRAHMISPTHIAMDKAKEAARGDRAIGTTLRGIGPAYLDKIGRSGILMGQMLDIETFADALYESIHHWNEELIRRGFAALDPQVATEEYLQAAERLQPFIRETSIYLYDQLKHGAEIVCEGAQGTLLDIDHGNYPFVTSSSPTIGGAMTGLGVGAGSIKRVVGVVKAFSTRVGSGPMPTELNGTIADKLRGTGENFWDEFGTTTGRTRRCGWIDTVLLRYATIVSGFTEIALTKLDILSGFDEIKVATTYEVDGERITFPPGTTDVLYRAVPIYETLPGWHEDVTTARRAEDLPENALQYIQRISELCDVPITSVSVGPERDQLVHLQ